MKSSKIGPIDIADQLSRIEKLLFDVASTITTTPALEMMYGVLGLELNYLKIRLNQDKKLLQNAIVFSSEPGGFRINYKEWHDKLERAKWKWGFKEFNNTDPVCYEDPGFDYKLFNEKHEFLWKRLHSELEEVVALLDEIHKIINYPSDEKIIETYNLLTDSYYQKEYHRDKEEFESFIISVPKRKDLRVKKLRNKLFEYKWSMKRSGVLDEMCCDVYIPDEKLSELETLGTEAILDFQREGVLKMFYDEIGDCWDKDVIGRYFFVNRRTIKPEQIYSFMRYIWQKEAIEKELYDMGIANELSPTDSPYMIDSRKNVFVSYPWHDKELMDSICRALDSNKIYYKRDSKDCGYRQNITNFEEQIADGDIVIAIINDTSMKSIDCMYEMCQLVANGHIEQRLFPIVDLQNISRRDSDAETKYLQYWEKYLDDRKVKLINDKRNSQTLLEEIKLCSVIVSEFGKLWKYLCRTNTLTKEKLMENDCTLLIQEIKKQLIDE